MADRRPPRALGVALLAVGLGCGGEAPPVAPPPDGMPPGVMPPDPPRSGSWARIRVQPLGGWRLDIPYAGDGLAVLADADGFAASVFTSGHLQQHLIHRTPLAGPPGGDTLVAAMPRLVPADTLRVDAVFPDLPAGQRVRDFAVVPSATGPELAALGRVFYHTAPRQETRIVVRALDAAGRPTGTTRFQPVPLPEQEFSGFIKHLDARRDLDAIGGGGYESGQGSVGGISYAVRRDGTWQRLLQPPPFGDLASPRLPRDTAYSCPGGASWVCLPPVDGRGVWSTERVHSGGVRLGDTVLFLPSLGYGERTYERQSGTFGDPSRDRVVLYRFEHRGTGDPVTLVGYEPWPFLAPGQFASGLALGRLRGVPDPVLFVLVGAAWGAGRDPDAPALLAFRLTTAR